MHPCCSGRVVDEAVRVELPLRIPAGLLRSFYKREGDWGTPPSAWPFDKLRIQRAAPGIPASGPRQREHLTCGFGEGPSSRAPLAGRWAVTGELTTRPLSAVSARAPQRGSRRPRREVSGEGHRGVGSSATARGKAHEGSQAPRGGRGTREGHPDRDDGTALLVISASRAPWWRGGHLRRGRGTWPRRGRGGSWGRRRSERNRSLCRQ